MKRIYKIEESRKIFGVCGGIAEYFDIDPVIVRIIWGVLACFFWSRNSYIFSMCMCICIS